MKAYLPNTVWYDISGHGSKVSQTGHVVIDDNKHGIPPIHVRGGYIIPMSTEYPHVNTQIIRNGSIHLLVLPDGKQTGAGDLFWDDGDGIDTIERSQYNYYTFNVYNNCTLDVNVIKTDYKTNQTIESIQIFATNGDPVSATLDGKPVSDVLVFQKVTKLTVKLDLLSKKPGDKWTLSWKSTKTNTCNFE